MFFFSLPFRSNIERCQCVLSSFIRFVDLIYYCYARGSDGVCVLPHDCDCSIFVWRSHFTSMAMNTNAKPTKPGRKKFDLYRRRRCWELSSKWMAIARQNSLSKLNAFYVMRRAQLMCNEFWIFSCRTRELTVITTNLLKCVAALVRLSVAPQM